MDLTTPQRNGKPFNEEADEIFSKSAVPCDLNEEFENAYQAAINRASRVSPRS